MKNQLFQLFIATVFLFIPMLLIAQIESGSTNVYNLSASSNSEENQYNRNEYPFIEVVGNTVHTVWYREVEGYTRELMYRESDDGGTTWNIPISITKTYSLASGIAGKTLVPLAVNGNNIHIVANKQQDGNSEILYCRSTDGGNTFSTMQTISTKSSQHGIQSMYIRSSGSNVAIVYTCDKKYGGYYDTKLLISTDSGETFTEKSVVDRADHIYDFLYDANQMILLTNHTTSYVLVSNDNGETFTSHDIGYKYTDEYGEHANSDISVHNYTGYKPKIVKTGSTIHIVHGAMDGEQQGHHLYVRSTDNGETFEESVDINADDYWGPYDAATQTIAAKGNNVYIGYSNYCSQWDCSGDRTTWLARSTNGGATIDTIQKITDDRFKNTHNRSVGIFIDPTDATGNTLYLTNPNGLLNKSVDGGKTFINTIFVPFESTGFPGLNLQRMAFDADGNPMIVGLLYNVKDNPNAFFAKRTPQPELANEDKVYKFSYDKTESAYVVIDDSPSLQFESEMSGDFWIRSDSLKLEESRIIEKLSSSPMINNGKASSMYMTARRGSSSSGEWVDMVFSFNTDNEPVQFSVKIDDDIQKWTHVAFSYQAGETPKADNLKVYVNGLLKGTFDTPGKLDFKKGMWNLGYSSNYYRESRNIYLDDFRFWNRVLTPEEVRDFQNKITPANQEGLKLWLTFDGSFRDTSGNGNNATPLYTDAYFENTIQPLFVDFFAVNNYDVVSFNNLTADKTAENFLWDFGSEEMEGDDKRKAQQFPNRPYDMPGKHLVTLQAENATTRGAMQKDINVSYFKSITSNEGYNDYTTTSNILASNITDETTVKLIQKNPQFNVEYVIEGKNNVVISDKKMKTTFDLSNKILGKYDVVLQTPGLDSLVLEKGFEVVDPSRDQKKYQIVSGFVAVSLPPLPIGVRCIGNRHRTKLWSEKVLRVLNDLYHDYDTPIVAWIVVEDAAVTDLQFTNISFDLPEAYPAESYAEVKEMPTYFVLDDFPGFTGKVRLYGIMIPKLNTREIKDIKFKVKSDRSSYDIVSFYTHGFYDDGGATRSGAQLLSPSQISGYYSCMAWAAAKMAVNYAVEQIPGVSCLQSIVSTVNTFSEPQSDEDFERYTNYTWSLLSTGFECVGEVIPGKKIYDFANDFFSAVGNFREVYKAHEECKEYEKKGQNTLDVDPVISLDPNEISGPKGYGEDNFISWQQMPYTILFENKNTATAAAQEVVILDTLNTDYYNLKTFRFGQFGYGYNSYNPDQEEFSFVKDIDLRPEQDAMLRVSGILDTTTHVVRWQFITLDPNTMELTTDPLAGFLPPNANAPEGEGFVSFSVDLNNNLTDGDVIENKADIIFDVNAPIVTNTWKNKLDYTMPISKVTTVQQIDDNAMVEIEFEGNDANGVGIRKTDLYISMDNGEFVREYSNMKIGEKIQIPLEVAHNYRFYTIASDSLGLEEPLKTKAEAILDVTSIHEIDGGDFFTIYPNPTKEFIHIGLKNKVQTDSYSIELITIDGRLVKQQTLSGDELAQGVKFSISEYPQGIYLLQLSGRKDAIRRKLVIE